MHGRLDNGINDVCHGLTRYILMLFARIPALFSHSRISMPLLTLRNISLAFGGPLLLDSVDLQIEPGERLCLLGRNGEGKSTLMKVLAGLIKADDGIIDRQQNLKVAYLTQDVPADIQGSVYDVVASGLDEVGSLLKQYHHTILQFEHDHDDALLEKLERIQHDLEAKGGWQFEKPGQRAILSNIRNYSSLTRLNHHLNPEQ